jgi:hypothetical protein
LNYGRLVNNVRVQDAKFKELVLAYQNTVLQANAEVEDGLAEFLQSQLQAKAMQRSVDAADKAVKLAIVQYKGGLVDFNRVALLQQNLVQQQNLLAQAQGDIALGLIRTYRALGGGWQIRCVGFDNIGAQSAAGGIVPAGEAIPPGKSTPGAQPSQPNSEPTPPQRGLPLEGPSGPLPPGAAPSPSSYWNNTPWNSPSAASNSAPPSYWQQASAAPPKTFALAETPGQGRFSSRAPATFDDPQAAGTLRNVFSQYPNQASGLPDDTASTRAH